MIENRVRELIEGPVNEMGILIDSISYDRDKIIDIDTCVEVTHVVDSLLDEVDILTDSYILDISSKEKGDNRNE